MRLTKTEIEPASSLVPAMQVVAICPRLVVLLDQEAKMDMAVVRNRTDLKATHHRKASAEVTYRHNRETSQLFSIKHYQQIFDAPILSQ